MQVGSPATKGAFHSLGFAKQDPASALAWSQEALPAPARAKAIGSIIGSIASEDLDMSIELVADLPPGGAKRQASESLLKAWLKDSASDVSAISAIER